MGRFGFDLLLHFRNIQATQVRWQGSGILVLCIQIIDVMQQKCGSSIRLGVGLAIVNTSEVRDFEEDASLWLHLEGKLGDKKSNTFVPRIRVCVSVEIIIEGHDDWCTL